MWKNLKNYKSIKTPSVGGGTGAMQLRSVLEWSALLWAVIADVNKPSN